MDITVGSGSHILGNTLLVISKSLQLYVLEVINIFSFYILFAFLPTPILGKLICKAKISIHFSKRIINTNVETIYMLNR